MAKEINFVDGVTVVPAAWLDEQQEVQSALAIGIRLERANPTQIRLPPLDDGNDAVAGQSALIINGQPRWWQTAIIKTVSGPAGTYGVYAVAGATTTLEAANISIATSAPPNSRKIGTVVWDGAQITTVRQDGIDSVSAAMLEDGVLSGEGDLVWTRDVNGAYVPTIKSDRGVLLPGDLVFAGSGEPGEGFLMCEGAAVNRTTYQRLFNKVGTKYGPGNGSTTFNVPDARGCVILGPDNGAGRVVIGPNQLAERGGEERHVLTAAELASHTHAGSSLSVVAALTGIGINGSFTGISIAAVGDHAHGLNAASSYGGGGGAAVTGEGGNRATSGAGAHGHGVNDPSHGHSVSDPKHGHAVSGSTGSAGSGSSHNNMQPYLVIPLKIKT